MQNNIDIEVKLDPNYTKPKLIIYTNNINDNINKIISKLQNNNDNTLIGYKDDQGFIIELKKIETIYTENKKVYAKSENETYQLKKRIFELEEALEEFSFVRISNSEIVNLLTIFVSSSSPDFILSISSFPSSSIFSLIDSTVFKASIAI